MDIPCMNQPVRHGIRTHAERPPFFRDGLRETDHSGFGSGVVGLADVPVQAAGGGDVDDGAVFLLVWLWVEEDGGRVNR